MQKKKAIKKKIVSILRRAWPSRKERNMKWKRIRNARRKRNRKRNIAPPLFPFRLLNPPQLTKKKKKSKQKQIRTKEKKKLNEQLTKPRQNGSLAQGLKAAVPDPMKCMAETPHSSAPYRGKSRKKNWSTLSLSVRTHRESTENFFATNKHYNKLQQTITN